jgi:hypothetical protein
MIVAYATQAGRTAEDGDGRNSPYTAAFLKNIEDQEEIGTIFRHISSDVYEATKHEQLPELSLSVIGEFYLRGKVDVPARQVDAAKGGAAASEAAQAWSATKDTMNFAVLEAFIQRYHDTFYADLARARLNDLRQSAKKPEQVAAVPLSGTGSKDASALTTPRQRAILYDEDPTNPKGHQYVGSVIWHTQPIKASGNQQADIAVRADIEIPDRKFKMTMSFRRNTDSSLPASHTAELTFILPPDFLGGGVSNVPGILMKSNEQARGNPLAGLAVKVTDGFFLVGLSNVAADRARNIQLLTERSWFDIPMIYNNQRRAILAFEKGAPGDAAFGVALAAQ